MTKVLDIDDPDFLSCRHFSTGQEVFYILVYNSNKMHKSQSLFNLTTALHVSGVTITHLQEHKTTVTIASGNRYTVINRVKFTVKRLPDAVVTVVLCS